MWYSETMVARIYMKEFATYIQQLVESKMKSRLVVCGAFSLHLLHSFLENLFVADICLNKVFEAWNHSLSLLVELKCGGGMSNVRSNMKKLNHTDKNLRLRVRNQPAPHSRSHHQIKCPAFPWLRLWSAWVWAHWHCHFWRFKTITVTSSDVSTEEDNWWLSENLLSGKVEALLLQNQCNALQL